MLTILVISQLVIKTQTMGILTLGFYDDYFKGYKLLTADLTMRFQKIKVLLQAIKILSILFFVTGLQFINSNVSAGQTSQSEINKYIDNLKKEELLFESMRNLVRIGKPAVPALIQALKSEDYYTRNLATEILGYIGSDAEAAIPALIPLLRQEPNGFAVGALSKIGKSAIKPLVLALKNNRDDNIKMYYGASTALSNIGEDAVPELTSALQSDNPEALIYIAYAISRIGRKASASVPGLIQNLQHPNLNVRLSMMWTLAAMRDGAVSAVPALVNALKDKEPQVRFVAAKALSEISSYVNLSSYTSVALPILIEMLPDAPNTVAPMTGILVQMQFPQCQF